MYFPHNEKIIRHDGLAAVRAKVALLPPSSSVSQIVAAGELAGIGAIKTTPVTAYLAGGRVFFAVKRNGPRYGKGIGAVEEPESATEINQFPGGYEIDEIMASDVWRRHMREVPGPAGEKMYIDIEKFSSKRRKAMEKTTRQAHKYPISAIVYRKQLDGKPLTGIEALWAVALILRRKRRKRRHKARLKKQITGVIVVAGIVTAGVLTGGFGLLPLAAAEETGVVAAGTVAEKAVKGATKEAVKGATKEVAKEVVKKTVTEAAKETLFDTMVEKATDKLSESVEDKAKKKLDQLVDKQKQEMKEAIEKQLPGSQPAPIPPGPVVVKKPLSKAAKTAIVAVPAAGILGTLAWYLIRR